MMAMPARRFTYATLSRVSLSSHEQHGSKVRMMAVTCLQQHCRCHALQHQDQSRLFRF